LSTDESSEQSFAIASEKGRLRFLAVFFEASRYHITPVIAISVMVNFQYVHSSGVLMLTRTTTHTRRTRKRAFHIYSPGVVRRSHAAAAAAATAVDAAVYSQFVD